MPGWLALGAALLLLGLLFPTRWYAELPQSPELPPPPGLLGVLLLKGSLVLEGLVVLLVGKVGWRYRRLAPDHRLGPGVEPADADTPPGPGFLVALVAVVAVGAGLRIFQLGADLWLDEITPILNYGGMSAVEVIATYHRTNNHLLNTLLLKGSIALFGESEWSVRIPAVTFGIATIPALYWLARLTSSRWTSLAAALLLAVSYHHVFFSQNARGYSAYLLFSLLATGLLVHGLRSDRATTWGLYIAATVLNMASLLLSAFVLVAHALVGLAAVLRVRRRGGSWRPLLARLTGVFAISAFLCFQLYALVIPHIYIVIRRTYSTPFAGYSPFSAEFLQELARGISAGFGTGLLLGAIPFVLLAGAGFLVLLRRDWILAAGLILPLMISGGFLVVQQLTFSPRFFLLALPVAILSAVQGIVSGADWLARLGGRPGFAGRGLALALVVLVALVSLTSLKGYFAAPKQPYRASLQYLESERANGAVAVVHLAEKGFRYYGRQFQIQEGRDYFYLRSEDALDELLAAQQSRPIFLVTTFRRALRMSYPDLNARVHSGWTVARSFPATVGDGGIQVWREQDASLSSELSIHDPPPAR